MRCLWMIFLAVVMALLVACSSDSSVAGTMIETNTGNKVLIETNTGNGFARVMVSIETLKASEGDTLQLSRMQRDTVGDTIRLTSYYIEDIINAVDISVGFASMDSVPAGDYETLTILPVEGDAHAVAVSLSAEEGETYRIDDSESPVVSVVVVRDTVRKGKASAYVSMDVLESAKAGDTMHFKAPVTESLKNDTLTVVTNFVEYVLTEDDLASKVVLLKNLPEGDYEGYEVSTKDSVIVIESPFTLAADQQLFVGSAKPSEVKKLTIELPEGFKRFAAVDETFNDMPLPVRFEKPMSRPCLVDALGGVVLLESTADSLLYWGRMDQVVFAEDSTIKFDVLENCGTAQDSVVLARRVEHLDNKTPSEDAVARFDVMDAAFGNALWTDSTDQWMFVEDFVPFTKDGYQMSASFWVKADSVSQPAPGKNFTRFLSAKADSMGFMVQQRGDHPTINVRIDAHRNGVGVYNTVYGYADILDGTWHNYSLTIRGDSLYAWADGVNVSRTQFENGGDFSALTNPTIGYNPNNVVGGMDEVFFFDGSQSECWMKLFYALQKQARE